MADTITPCQAAAVVRKPGYPVLPLHSVTEDRAALVAMRSATPGQASFRPLVPHGLKDATTDLDVIRGWFREHYWLNYGVLTEGCSSSTLIPATAATRAGHDQRPAYPRRAPHMARAHRRRRRAYLFSATPSASGAATLTGASRSRPRAATSWASTAAHESGRRYAWQPQCSPKDAPLADPPEWLAKLIGNRTYLGAADTAAGMGQVSARDISRGRAAQGASAHRRQARHRSRQ